MTAITVSEPVNMANDAGFRAWGLVWSTNLAALGWVKTADTGQINWATVTKPGVANTVAGYEIWRMNDSLQGTAPIYIKIEYGTGSAVTYSALWLTLGFSTDGAGNLNSTNLSTRTQINTTQNSVTAYDWKFCGSNSRLGVMEIPAVVAQVKYIFIERTHNSDGTDNAQGAMMVFGSNQAGNFAQLVTASGALPVQTRYSNTTGNITNATSFNPASNQLGSNVYLSPVRVFGAGESSPMFGLMGYYSSDLTTGNLTTITDWTGSGASVFPSGMAPSYFAATTLSIAMRFS